MERMAVGLRDLKLADAGAEMSFSGYGAVFGNVDSYGDVIAPGAFADTLANASKTGQWPAMLSQHGGWGMSADDMMPIGIWTELAEDGHGLKVTGKLADTPRGRDAYALLKMDPRPAIDGLSIGYIAKAFEARTKPDEPRRKLTKIDLFEISLVTFPANPKARLTGVKSGGDMTIREFEAFLRDAGGFSAAKAKAIAASGYKAAQPRDEGAAGDLADMLRRNIHTLKSRKD
jgi:HK97 family phage prohead protease